MGRVDFHWTSHGDFRWDTSVRPVWLAGLFLVDVGVVRLSTRDAGIARTSLPKEPLVWLDGRF